MSDIILAKGYNYMYMYMSFLCCVGCVFFPFVQLHCIRVCELLALIVHLCVWTLPCVVVVMVLVGGEQWLALHT